MEHFHLQCPHEIETPETAARKKEGEEATQENK